ncbi:MAG TPA: hypothetical protein VJ349_04560 [Stellaceae bacterium]|nr:hypothetical protein [Stellaceae bacterium]
MPITSRPDMTVGMVCAWIGVGVWYFSSARARKRDSLSSKAVKTVKFAVCVIGQDIAFYLWDAKPAGARCAPADLRVGKDIPRDLGCQ